VVDKFKKLCGASVYFRERVELMYTRVDLTNGWQWQAGQRPTQAFTVSSVGTSDRMMLMLCQPTGFFFAYFLYILSDRMMLMCFVRRASLTKFRYLRIFYKFCQRPYLVGKKLAKVTFPTPVALVSKKTHVARFVCLW
jgi:hypothetical protein